MKLVELFYYFKKYFRIRKAFYISALNLKWKTSKHLYQPSDLFKQFYGFGFNQLHG